MGRCWFAVESKSFDIPVEELGKRLRGVIVERGRGFSSWVRFGELSLGCILAGVEACCRDVWLSRWNKGWEEGGRKVKLECRENGAGRFIFCKAVTAVMAESKSFSLVFPEGRGNHGGWLILAEKLRSLGVAPIFEEKKVESSVENGGSWKAGSGSMSYVNAVRKNEGLVEETAWLQIGEGDVQDREGGEA